MTYKVEIKRVSDGLVLEIPESVSGNRCNYQDIYADDGKRIYGDRFLWEEGNWSCDCNRSHFFYKTANEEEPGEPDCGNTAFLLRVTSEDGSILYDEF